VGDLATHLGFLTVDQLIPVIHLQSRDGERKLGHSETLNVFKRIASELKTKLIAVPERELGPGLISKAQLVRKIVSVLPTPAPALHVLGCGNLLSFAFLTAAGAQLFDGLEWYRTCFSSDFHLHHFQQGELFDPPADDPPNLSADWLLEQDLPYPHKLAVRNLKALQSYTNQLQISAEAKRIHDFVSSHFGDKASQSLLDAIK
jgi:hypothetical protein